MPPVLDRLAAPIVQAPLAGGASTPELAAAVCGAGGLGFIATGYRDVDPVRMDIRAIRELTTSPFGVNLFVPGEPADPGPAESYAGRLCDEGLEAGEPRWEDDGWEAKLDLLLAERPAVASFTFGCPQAGMVAALREAGVDVWVTVTSPEEASRAAEAGADALIAQGVEAGGHRGAFGPETARPGETRLTRAFTGKPARGLVNRFLAEHEDAPEAYPELHHVTAPIRAAARERGDPEEINLWAGQTHELAPKLPAAEVVRRLTPA
jgi:nitronate monooxygenase